MMGRGGKSAVHIKRWQTHALILLSYTVLALALTWPLVVQFGSHVPGNGVDDPPLTWNLWWVRYALQEQGINPFLSDYLFYPLGINLALYTLTLLNGLLSIPFQMVWGLVPASNLLLLSSFVLSGYGLFLLALYVLAPQFRTGDGARSAGLVAAAFAGGLLYAFASVKMGYAALGQWNIASSQWVPFYVLYLCKMGAAPNRRRYPLLAALFLLFQAYAELTYATFLVLFTGLWAVWHLVARLRAGQKPLAVRSLLNLAVIGGLFLLGLAPVLAMMLPDMLAEGDIMVVGTGFADVFSADLLGFFVPTLHHPLLGSLVERFGFDHTVGQHIYLGYAVLALAGVGIVSWVRRVRGSKASARSASEPGRSPGFWLLSTLAFWLLTLGPSLRINGQSTGIPLPFAFVAQLPFFEGNRYPSRYGVMLFLGLAVLIAMGLATLVQRWQEQPRRVGVVLPAAWVLLMAFEHLCLPLPMTDMRIPSIYERIAEEMPGDWTLLDLPVAWRNGFRVTGTQHPIIMLQQYYQTAHEKRILAGNTSRNPPLKFQYFTEAPVINTLIALETGHAVNAAIAEEDRAWAADVLRFFDIQAIVVHTEQTGPEMIPYLEATMPLRRWLEQDGVIVYQTDLPPWPERWEIEPGHPLARLSLAEGWGVPAQGVVWAQRRDVRLLVPLNGEAQSMTFRAYAPQAGQQMRVEVGGQEVGRVALAPGWGEYRFDLPDDSVTAGLNLICLHFVEWTPATDVAQNSRTIGRTGVESPVNLVVASAGQEVGDLGQVFVDGHDVSVNERGYNVVVIDASTGQVLRSANFDTHLDPGAALAMAEFLEAVPSGQIVAVAAADEASRLLDERVVQALHGIGAVGDLRGRFRWGHAVIGVKGAAPGTAVEALDGMRPVFAVAGEGATEPGMTAAFSFLRFESISR